MEMTPAEMEQEIARLRDELGTLQEKYSYDGQVRPRERELEDQIEILKAENERLREDAERWIKVEPHLHLYRGDNYWHLEIYPSLFGSGHPDTLVAAIDAAREE